MNTFARYAIFILVMGVIIVILANLLPNFYTSVLGVVRIARIQVHTELSVGSDFLMGVSSVDSIISQLKSADADSEIKAVILDINSGGGGVVASYELASAIKIFSKPIVTVIREVGASGAYWAAAASDYVFANQLSMVGSVGVIGSYLVFEGLMEQYGISEVRAVSGDMKDFGSPYRNITVEEQDDFNDLINKTFQVFSQDIIQLRNLSENSVEQVITGKIFLGSDALEVGLIDEVGGIDAAENYLKILLGVDEVEYVEQSQSFSVLDLLSGVKQEFSQSLFFPNNNLFLRT